MTELKMCLTIRVGEVEVVLVETASDLQRGKC